jgi:hypothetical protein
MRSLIRSFPVTLGALLPLVIALAVSNLAVRPAHASSASNEFICTKTAYAPGALSTLTQASTTVSCPGVVVGDICDGISSTVDPGAGIVLTCYISAAGTVRIQVFNSTAGTLTPASANYTVLIQPKYISP